MFAAAAAAMMFAGAASAATLAQFDLNGNTVNAAGGAITLTDNSGGGLGATGITFGANGGPTLNNIGLLTEYSLETEFSFDDTGSYRKIADFFNLTSDTGFYNLGGALNFYPLTSGPPGMIANGQLVRVKLTRDAASTVTGYVGGVQQFFFDDSVSNLAVINNTLHLFRDDSATGGGEASAGFVNYIRLADAGGFTQVSGAVPEPATWALMIGGFGAAGAMLRRRRATGLYAA